MVRRTFNPETEGYMVVAGREWALVTSEPLAGVDTHFGRSERPHIGSVLQLSLAGSASD
jgi:hypothetical protein